MFSSPTYPEWLRLVEEELKAPATEYSVSAELKANPFVKHEGAASVSIHKPGEGWIISQPAESAEEVLESLEGGAGGITLRADANTVFPHLLENVYLDFITLRVRVEDNKPLRNLHQYIVSKGYDLSKLDIVVQGLPLAKFKTANKLYRGHLSLEIADPHVDVSVASLARLLTRAEKTVFTEGIRKVVFSLPVQENFYLNLASVKALRYLWQKIEEVNEEIVKSRILVIINSGPVDPNLQVIANTQMVASSAIGGADWIESVLLPYPEPQYSRAFSRRINRNIQHILQKESFLDRVDDAAAGSWFLDDLTRKIITQTWEKFLTGYE